MSPERSPIHVAELCIPGTSAPSQGRKRPLRTYGRRSAQAGPQEHHAPQTPKAQKSASPDLRDTILVLGSAESHAQLPALPDKGQTGRPSRGSILAYFKPLAPSSASDPAPSDVVSSDPAEDSSTPPPTPRTPPSRSRKRRRLTTRPQLSGIHRHSDTPGEAAAPEFDQASATEAQSGAQRRPPIHETTAIIVSHDACNTLRPALGEVAGIPVDQENGPVSAPEPGRTKTKRPTWKRPTKDMTQTTLSLSVQKEPGFTICGVCDILFNPLNEKDRREHNRRHTAYSRKKKREAS